MCTPQLLDAGDVRRGGQRGRLQTLRPVVQEVHDRHEESGARQGSAGGGLPPRGGALHLHDHQREAAPGQGESCRTTPLLLQGSRLSVPCAERRCGYDNEALRSRAPPPTERHNNTDTIVQVYVHGCIGASLVGLHDIGKN